MDGSESIRIATPAAGRRLPRRGVLIALGAWVVVVAGALTGAAVLDTPPAPPPPASVAPSGLPRLFLYMDRPLPAKIAKLTDFAAQIERLQELATTTDSPARWTELGMAAQRVGDLGAAKLAFQRALLVDPGRLEAQVGLAMTDGASGPEGLARASTALSALAPDHPTSQLLAFNAAMVAVYRADARSARSGFQRAEALGPATPLGLLARRFGRSTTTP